MSRPKKHLHYVRSAREEAMLACDLYNQRRRSRNLEAFIVHMSIAWLNLFHAMCARDGVDCRYKNGRRIERIDGEPKTWDLTQCVRHFIKNNGDPVRKNIEFFIAIRNIIEHRYTATHRANIELIVAGKVQAMFLNFEHMLVAEFGKTASLGDVLRFPIFLSSLTEDAVSAVKQIYAQIPRATKTLIETFEAGIDADVLANPSYEFRVLLIPKTGPKSKADLAIKFLNISNLSVEELRAMPRGVVITKERRVETANLDRMKAGEVVAKVQAVYPSFSIYGGHYFAWRYFKVRPNSKSSEPSKTMEQYCFYDKPHKDYVYTEAWVEKLKAELADKPAKRIATWKRALAEEGK